MQCLVIQSGNIESGNREFGNIVDDRFESSHDELV